MIEPPTATAVETATIVQPKPFLKWAGGKGQLLSELIARLPDDFRAYHEPFVGSGALFFDLARRGRLSKVHLSDVNPPLIYTYIAVQKDVEKIISFLKRHRRSHSRAYYYQIRGLNPMRSSAAGRAARLIYLNRTCFNGLYRENRLGQFNVPYGKYKNPTICDVENLRAVSRALRRVTLARLDYQQAMSQARPGDFVYLDPPYHPLSATSSFTSYDRDGFGIVDQCKLRVAFEDLVRRGVYVMMSNSDTPLINELYARFNVERVHATRLINSKGDRRGKISELIVRNYG